MTPEELGTSTSAAILAFFGGIAAAMTGGFEMTAICFAISGVLGTIVIKEYDRQAMKRRLGRRR